jgi:pimeloyl-ACP methyl ester carboxylesterase
MADVRSGFARAADGIHLYYRTVGDGPPMVCCNGVGVSTFFWKYIARHFRDRFQVVLWDYRGHGKSGTPPDPRAADLSMERNARDLEAVMDAVGLDQPAIMLGHSMGVQVILESCRLDPDRVRALIPLFGTFARPMDTFMDSPHSRKIFDVINRVAALTGKAGGRILHPLYANPLAFAIGKSTGLVDRYYASKRDIDAYMEHLVHMDPQVFLRMVEFMADHDLTDFLPEIDCPVLIFAGEKDLFTPLHRSRKMRELIADSEMFIVAEGSHAAIVEHPETINLRIERFLAERVFTAAEQGASATG